MKTPAIAAALLLAVPLLASAQIDCWAPHEEQDRPRDARFAAQLGWLQRAEAIVRRDAAFQATPEPARMRVTYAIGPYHPSGARLFVRAYPELVTDSSFRIWTAGCTVSPQAEALVASIGQIDVFLNHPVQDMFLSLGGVPRYEGQVGGYPRYNGWVVITKGGRLPWVPQTLADRLDAEAARRERALADWRAQMAAMKTPDRAAMEPALQMMRKKDPAAADKLVASLDEQARELRRLRETVHPALTAQFEKEVADLQRYRAGFSDEQLRMPAVWTDAGGAGKRRLDERIRELHALSADEQQQITSKARTAAEVQAAHRERAQVPIRDAMAQHALAWLQPGPAEQAIAFKPDPGLPNMKNPDRLQLITVLFSEDRRRQRLPWMQAARNDFDFKALAALLD